MTDVAVAVVPERWQSQYFLVTFSRTQKSENNKSSKRVLGNDEGKLFLHGEQSNNLLLRYKRMGRREVDDATCESLSYCHCFTISFCISSTDSRKIALATEGYARAQRYQLALVRPNERRLLASLNIYDHRSYCLKYEGNDYLRKYHPFSGTNMNSGKHTCSLRRYLHLL